MAKKNLVLILLLLLGLQTAAAQNAAHERASRLKAGMNLSYLDNYWRGTKQKHFADFVKPNELSKRGQMLADIAKANFKTIRLPICFGAWASLEAPFDWETKDGLEAADLLIKTALENNLNVIVDLHHTEFDNSFPHAASTARLVSLWQRVAERYKNTDPQRVFFELRNEPHDIAAEVWRAQAETLIKTVRRIAPNHTLIVGFHDWNSRQAMIDSKPFADSNIIYTFHYYDPFVFTHQGATWSSEGLPDLRNVPFPSAANKKIEVPSSAKGKWTEKQINNYEQDSQPSKMFEDLKAAKKWSVDNRVPIFLGEFGSYDKYAAPADRCRHAAVVYAALGKLDIPNAWWEWDGGFNMFEPNTTKIMSCLRQAVDYYQTQTAIQARHKQKLLTKAARQGDLPKQSLRR